MTTDATDLLAIFALLVSLTGGVPGVRWMIQRSRRATPAPVKIVNFSITNCRVESNARARIFYRVP